MLLSAIPTWFGENAAVQISKKGGEMPTPFEIQKVLKEHDIDPLKIEQKPDRTIVVLDSTKQQTDTKSSVKHVGEK